MGNLGSPACLFSRAPKGSRLPGPPLRWFLIWQRPKSGTTSTRLCALAPLR